MFRHRMVIWVVVLAMLLTYGCTTLPRCRERTVSYAYSDTRHTSLGRFVNSQTPPLPAQSGIKLLENGIDAFAAWLMLIDHAERSIDAQYYLLHDDFVGSILIHHLCKAADRGVRVRILVDDNGFLKRDHAAAVLNSHANIHWRVFNPFSRHSGRIMQLIFSFDNSRVTRRMHNKTFVVDNQIAILGSRNIGNSYFGADGKLAYQDLDVLAIGPVVEDISRVFDHFWNSQLSFPISTLWEKPVIEGQLDRQRSMPGPWPADYEQAAFFEALKHSQLPHSFREHQMNFHWVHAEVIYDPPEKILDDTVNFAQYLSSKLSPLFYSAQQELIIISPYFIPGKQGVALLQDRVAHGVRVRILTNSLGSTDVSVVHSGYAKYREALLQAGVELYELNKTISRKERKKKGKQGSSMASLHTKAFVFDRQKIFIGSMNLDPRAIRYNTEIGVVLTSKEIAGNIGQWFDDNVGQMAFRLDLETDEDHIDRIVWYGMQDGQKQKYLIEPYSSFWRRLGIGLMGILPIESHL